MTKETVHEAWSPTNSIWSDWAKPVLFACMTSPPPVSMPWTIPVMPDWLPAVSNRVMIILDLPGVEAVRLSLAIASAGYRPVPLFNAVPAPDISAAAIAACYSGENRVLILVDVISIMRALWEGAETLQTLNIPTDAPPVFMLDANRRNGRIDPQPGRFDNRSASSPIDFPSADFLKRQNIHKAILVLQSDSQPQPDLAETLWQYQAAGMPIEIKCLTQPGTPVPTIIQRPSWTRRILHRLFVTCRLSRYPIEGFGFTISAGSGAG